MTSKLDEELERLSKAAEQEDDDVRYYGGPTSTHRPARDAYHAALVQHHRTGQLVPAQPSGDVVEAVARAIYEEDDPWCKAWPWPNLQPDQAGADAYRRIATAAITTYEAVSGVAKMRDALKKTMTALAEAIEEERARINSMRGAVLERTTNRDLAAIAEWQSAVDAARAALRAQEAGDV